MDNSSNFQKYIKPSIKKIKPILDNLNLQLKSEDTETNPPGFPASLLTKNEFHIKNRFHLHIYEQNEEEQAQFSKETELGTEIMNFTFDGTKISSEIELPYFDGNITTGKIVNLTDIFDRELIENFGIQIIKMLEKILKIIANIKGDVKNMVLIPWVYLNSY